MIHLVVLLDHWEAKGSKADVPRRAAVILIQANLNQMKAEVLSDGLLGLSVV